MSGLILGILGPIVIGPLTFALMQGIKTVNGAVDTMPPMMKRITVAAIALVLTALAKVTGAPITCDLAGDTNCLTLLDNEAVKALVASVVAFALHWLKNMAKQAKSDG